jgi:phosphodiesterase/alkaline phosphatase D-like protein
MYMNRLLLRLAITVAAGSLVFANPVIAQESPTTPKAARVRITQGPEIEMAKLRLTIIRWTTNNPGGSPVHYGVVHYGTDPKNLNQIAKNPTRLNPYHPDTIFRVRLDDLKPATTYYYTVASADPMARTMERRVPSSNSPHHPANRKERAGKVTTFLMQRN